MTVKKHLALNNRVANVHNKVFLPGNGVMMMGKGIAPVRRIVNEVTDMMGGLLISDKAGNVIKGGKINRIPQKKPIKFII